MSAQPIYNIGAVSRMTGISMATLRAWERRYGFPHSSRTAGGHRLYSEEDVARLRWVKAKIGEGMQTAQAIHALGQAHTLGGTARAAVYPTSDQMAMLRERLLDALVRHAIEQADQVLGEALPLYSLEGLMLELIEPVLAEIGEGWAAQRISVATEHLATSYLRQRLTMWMVSGPPTLPLAPIVLACAPGEWHEGSLLMLGALLRRRRYPIAYLGQAVPLSDLAKFVREVQPSLVVLVAMMEATAGALAEWQQWLPEVARTGKPFVTFGGRIFNEKPEWQTQVPGIFLGATIRTGLEKIEALLQ